MAGEDVSTLRAALDAANARTAAATQRATAAEGRAHTATVNQLAAQEQSFDGLIASANAAHNLARQKWVALQEDGKYEEASIALTEMQEAATAVSTLKAQKAYVANQREAAARAPAPPADPTEGFAPAEQAWLREHPQYFSDNAYQAKINAAANNAEHVLGHARGSEAWFDAINKVAHPDRYQNGGGGNGGGNGGGSGAGDVDDQGAFSDTGDTDLGGGAAPQQRHTIEAPQVAATPEVPVMRTGETPEEPQARAIGRGGSGLSATAAPPSRRVGEAGRAVTAKQVSLSTEEYEAAVALSETIEPEIARQGQQKIAEWYYMMLHHPSNTNNNRATGTRRAKQGWSREAILA